MRVVEELVRRKLQERAPDEFSPKPDPYELLASRGCSLLFPTATQTEGSQSGQTLLSQIQQASNFNGDWLSNTVSEIQQKQLKRFYQKQQQQTTKPHYRLTQRGRTVVEATLPTVQYPLHDLKKGIPKSYSTMENLPISKENICATLQSWGEVQTC